MTRYAIYYAPQPNSSWWRRGSAWLGRDARKCTGVRQPVITGITPLQFAQLTAQARRYGFHATLKAPFRLNDGVEEKQLIEMAENFAARQKPILIERLEVNQLRGFLALLPASNREEIGALAMQCVSHFDMLRAPPTRFDIARQQNGHLSERQKALFQKWGYPYTEEEFCFHMTLTGSLGDAHEKCLQSIQTAAESHFLALHAEQPLVIDGISIFRETEPGMPCHYWQRFSFSGHHSMQDSYTAYA
ncbi:MAG: hypothetical protein K0S28_2192 [Paucimonas sp.]|jgi:ribose 1,5-bisphosphokinase|nr:hypothetical protein [Paucimonas sp.]